VYYKHIEVGSVRWTRKLPNSKGGQEGKDAQNAAGTAWDSIVVVERLCYWCEK